MRNNNNKNLLRGYPKQSTIAGSFWLSILKKMITEMLLILPLHLILFFIWWRFQPLIKAMTDVGDIFDGDFFGDAVDTPKEGIEQH